MSARIVPILAFALIAGCGGGGGSSGGPPPVPSGFLYATAVGGPNASLSDIYGFTVYSDGELSLVPGSPASAQHGPVALTRDSKLLYTTNDFGIDAFHINPDGSLTNAPNNSFDPGPYTPFVGLVAHPAADFLYASSGFSNDVVSVFTIDPETGALNLASSVSVPNVTGNGAIQIEDSGVITPDGRYFYQSYAYYTQFYGQFPEVVQIVGFSIDSATGALSPVPGNPVSPPIPTTSSPGPMAIDPTGKFLYAGYDVVIVGSDGSDGGVAAYSIEPTSGELIAVPGSPFSVGGVPISAAIDASGKFLIVSTTPRLGGAAGNCLAVLSIDSVTGALTPVSGSPFGPPQYSCGVVVADPSQPFVYVGESANSRAAVSVFSIDQSTGALAAIGQNTVPDSSKLSVGPMARTP